MSAWHISQKWWKYSTSKLEGQSRGHNTALYPEPLTCTVTEQITTELFIRKYETVLLTLYWLTDLPGFSVWGLTSPDRKCEFFRALQMWLCPGEAKTKTQWVTLEFSRPPGDFHFQPLWWPVMAPAACRHSECRYSSGVIQADIKTHYVLMESGKLCMLLKHKIFTTGERRRKAASVFM